MGSAAVRSGSEGPGPDDVLRGAATGGDPDSACARQVAETVSPVCGGLGILFAVFAVAHALVQPRAVAEVMSPLAGVTSAGLLAAWSWTRSHPVPPAWSHLAATALALVAAVNALVHLALTADPLQTTNLILVTLGVGLFHLSWWSFSVSVAATVGGWAVVSWLHPDPRTLHFAFALLAAVVLASLVHRYRLQTASTSQRLIQRIEANASAFRQALAASESERSWTRSVLDALPVGLYVVDRDLIVRAWNRSREEGPLGVTHEAAIGKPLRQLIGPGFGAAEAALRNVFDTAREHVGTVSKGFRTFEVRRRPVLTGGEVSHVLSTFEDVTVATRADEALRQSEEWFRSVFRESPAPTLVRSTNPGRFKAANRAAEELLGWAQGELATMQVEQVFPAELRGFGHANTPARTRDGRTLVLSVDEAPVQLEGQGAVLTTLREAHRPEARWATRPAGAGRTVLVVEDDHAVRRILGGTLKALGYRVLEAAEGRQALDLSGRERVDLLLSDVLMPGMDGRELADALLARQPDLPVVFVSGQPREVLVRNARLRDGDLLLEKPVQPQVLLATVERALAERAAG